MKIDTPDTLTARACELRAEGLREIIEALRIALTDWQELEQRAQVEGVDVTDAAQAIAATLQQAEGLIRQAR